MGEVEAAPPHPPPIVRTQSKDVIPLLDAPGLLQCTAMRVRVCGDLVEQSRLLVPGSDRKHSHVREEMSTRAITQDTDAADRKDRRLC